MDDDSLRSDCNSEYESDTSETCESEDEDDVLDEVRGLGVELLR